MKICENNNCWEVMWGFPIKKCQFCGSEDYYEERIKLGLVLWYSSAYHHENRRMCVIKNYKWMDHLIIRTRLWDDEWNDCDNNGWYIHHIWIDDAEQVLDLISRRITKFWEYVYTKKEIAENWWKTPKY